MTDIVERLRGFYAADSDNWLDEDESGPLMIEAADEIERLRKLLNVVRIQMKNQDRRESEEPLYRAICAALAVRDSS